jgi:hypothetical protein
VTSNLRPQVDELWWLKATHVGDGLVDYENPRQIVRVLDIEPYLSDSTLDCFDVQVIWPIEARDDGIRPGVGLEQFERQATAQEYARWA